MRTTAALYIDPGGPYPRLAGVDAWDRERDATRYEGPHPIVAHPACGPWGRLRHLYRGGEGGPELAIRAVEQVRRWGGVLEHPAHSHLWAHCALPPPGCEDEHGGYTIAVNQSDWGHVARKATWVYCVRVPPEAVPPPPYRDRAPTHWCSGGRDFPGRKHRGMVAPPGIKCCSAQQRRRTPPLFAAWLVSLARAVV